MPSFAYQKSLPTLQEYLLTSVYLQSFLFWSFSCFFWYFLPYTRLRSEKDFEKFSHSAIRNDKIPQSLTLPYGTLVMHRFPNCQPCQMPYLPFRDLQIWDFSPHPDQWSTPPLTRIQRDIFIFLPTATNSGTYMMNGSPSDLALYHPFLSLSRASPYRGGLHCSGSESKNGIQKPLDVHRYVSMWQLFML